MVFPNSPRNSKLASNYTEFYMFFVNLNYNYSDSLDYIYFCFPSKISVLLRYKMNLRHCSQPYIAFLCNRPLKNASDLKDSLDSLYSVAAQYDVPSNYVNMVCKGIDGGSKGTDILGRIFSGVVAYYGEKDCYDFGDFFSAETLDGWDWQVMHMLLSIFVFCF